MDHLDEAQINAYLDAVLDGDLDPAVQRRVSAHLAECPACREQAAALEGVFAALAAVPEAPFEGDLLPGVLRGLPPAGRVRPAGATLRLPAWAMPLGLAQLAAGLALLAWIWPELAGPGWARLWQVWTVRGLGLDWPAVWPNSGLPDRLLAWALLYGTRLDGLVEEAAARLTAGLLEPLGRLAAGAHAALDQIPLAGLVLLSLGLLAAWVAGNRWLIRSEANNE